MAKVGRNAPCPCGSGRKYKRCCLGDEQALGRLYPLLIDLTEEMTHFAEERYGEDILGRAWLDFWEEEPPEHWEGSELFDLFIGWFSFLWVPEGWESKTGVLPHPDTLAAQMLESGWKLGPAARQLLAAARQEPLAFWEIESTDGQGRAGLRDLVLGRRLEVWLPPPYQMDRGGRHGARPGRSRPAGPTSSEPSPRPWPEGSSGTPCETDAPPWRENRGVRSPRGLLPYDLDFLYLYHRLVQAVLKPRLTNSDGERVAFTWSVYTFEEARRAELMGLLRSMRNLRYLGDPLDPLGSGEDGEQLPLDLGLAGPLPFRGAEEEAEGEEEGGEPGDGDEDDVRQKLLPFPGLPRDTHREEEDDRVSPSEEIERWMDAEVKWPSMEQPAFVWRIRRPEAQVPETTMARIHVLADRLLTVTNSDQRDRKLRRRLQRNARHILAYMGTGEQPFWEMAGVFADEEN